MNVIANLPEKWRAEAQDNEDETGRNDSTARALRACADELSATLAEAGEARDAADARRYRYLRDHCKREWYSDMPHNKGAPSLDIEFEARGHDLDAAIDTALDVEAIGLAQPAAEAVTDAAR